jgi:hypothetical protein
MKKISMKTQEHHLRRWLRPKRWNIRRTLKIVSTFDHHKSMGADASEAENSEALDDCIFSSRSFRQLQ